MCGWLTGRIGCISPCLWNRGIITTVKIHWFQWSGVVPCSTLSKGGNATSLDCIWINYPRMSSREAEMNMDDALHGAQYHTIHRVRIIRLKRIELAMVFQVCSIVDFIHLYLPVLFARSIASACIQHLWPLPSQNSKFPSKEYRSRWTKITSITPPYLKQVQLH